MNNRRRITGVVTSNKMEKTAVVEISRTYRHELYKKVIHSYKRVMAHDELGCEVGDHVIIVESRPISKRKQWVVQEILRHDIAAAEAELLQQQAQAETVEIEAKMESEAEVDEVEEVEDVETAEEVEPEPEAELESQESGEEPEMDEEPGMAEESESSEDDEAESEVSPEETDAEDKE
jgi:small subunit ribosomal protein S17